MNFVPLSASVARVFTSYFYIDINHEFHKLGPFRYYKQPTPAASEFQVTHNTNTSCVA
jgi:hypothetical protein